MIQIFAGLFTEGSSDVLFLESIVERTLQSVAFECQGEIDIEVKTIQINKSGLSFVNQVFEASKKGFSDFGITILCVHADADDSTLDETYKNKINPVTNILLLQDENKYCKILAAVVPIQEIESWMLSDKELFKAEINTKKSDLELGIHRLPETIANPKEVVENAIRIARETVVKRRRNNLTISDLYLPLGISIDLEKLEQLPSFQDFKKNIRIAFRSLNLLQE